MKEPLMNGSVPHPQPTHTETVLNMEQFVKLYRAGELGRKYENYVDFAEWKFDVIGSYLSYLITKLVGLFNHNAKGVLELEARIAVLEAKLNGLVNAEPVEKKDASA